MIERKRKARSWEYLHDLKELGGMLKGTTLDQSHRETFASLLGAYLVSPPRVNVECMDAHKSKLSPMYTAIQGLQFIS